MKEVFQLVRIKTTQTLICFIAFAVLPYCIPALNSYRLPLPTGVLSLFHQSAITAATTSTTVAAAPASKAQPAQAAITAPPQLIPKPGEIEDPSGRALAHLFNALQHVETNGGQARITHYGDSPITNDGITATVRRKLQQRFGDAGHGFILAAKPWGWYQHDGVKLDARGWQSNPLWFTRGDHLFGGQQITIDLQRRQGCRRTLPSGDHIQLLARAVDCCAPGGTLVACMVNDEGARSGESDLKALAGLAGVIGGNAFVTEPGMAAAVGSVIFVVVVVGGMGSLAGAFLASVLIGVLQTFAVAIDASMLDLTRALGWVVTPDTAGYVVLRLKVSQVAPILPYLLLVLVLIFRPKGLLGTREG